ncbi:MAG: type II toxin-antitoxin system VapC family toxin [Desulfohalobiaceae bacterium]
MRKVMIDTTIYSLALRGDHTVADLLRRIESIGISTISVGELLAGFQAGNREKKNREELELFLDSPRVTVFDTDVESADFYASIFNQLKRAGTPIPTNDIWIAATAFQHGYKLLSSDRHFDSVQGLFLIKPE